MIENGKLGFNKTLYLKIRDTQWNFGDIVISVPQNCIYNNIIVLWKILRGVSPNQSLFFYFIVLKSDITKLSENWKTTFVLQFKKKLFFLTRNKKRLK